MVLISVCLLAAISICLITRQPAPQRQVGLQTPAGPGLQQSALDQSPASAGDREDSVAADPARQARVENAYGKLPMQFEANEGHVASEVKFISRGSLDPSGNAYVTGSTGSAGDFLMRPWVVWEVSKGLGDDRRSR